MASYWILRTATDGRLASARWVEWAGLRMPQGALVLAAGLALGVYLTAAGLRFQYLTLWSPWTALLMLAVVGASFGFWFFLNRMLAVRMGLAPRDVAPRSSLLFCVFLTLLLATLEFRLLLPSPTRVLATLALVALVFVLLALFLFTHRARRLMESVEARAWPLLHFMGLSYGLITFGLTMTAYRNFTQPDFNPDSAYYNQVFWNTTQGRFFQGTLWQERSYRPPARNSFALHNSPVLILLTPLYALYPSYGTLMALKGVAIVLCILPLFLLARLRADALSGLIVAGAFLLYPTMVYKSLGAFHEILFAGFPLLMAFYFFETERFVPFMTCCALALMAREDVGLTAAVFGLHAGLRRMEWRWIVVPFVFCVGWYLFSVLILMPAVSPSSGQRLVALFAPFGSSYGEIARNMVTHPMAVIGALFNRANLAYLLKLLEPVGPLALANAANLFLAPSLLVNMLASHVSSPVADTSYHYSFLPAAILFVGLIYNLGRLGALSAWFGVEVRMLRPALLMMTLLLLPIALKDLIAYSPLQTIADARRRPAAERAIRLIPDDAAVAAPSKLLPHLSQRRRLYAVDWIADYPSPALDYVILDAQSQSYERTSEGYRRFIAQVQSGGAYDLVFNDNGLEVYRRAGGR